MAYWLTPHALERILRGEEIKRPVLQIIAYKLVLWNGEQRFRLLASDGFKTYQYIMIMSPSMVEKVMNGCFEKFTVVEVIHYTLEDVSDKRIIIIEDASPIKRIGYTIGRPTAIQLSDVKAPVSLTSGAIDRILKGESIERSVLQVVAYKIVPDEGQERFRLSVSDGRKTYQYFMAESPKIVQDVKNGHFERFTVFKLNQYTVQDVFGKRLIFIDDAEVMKRGQDVGRMIEGSSSIEQSNVEPPTQLTPNALVEVLSGKKIKEPILQILALKSVNGLEAECFQLTLSDGTNFHEFFMIASSQTAHDIQLGNIGQYAIIRMDNYGVGFFNGNYIISLREATFLKRAIDVFHMIGNPSKVKEDVLKDTALNQVAIPDQFVAQTS